MMKTTMIWIACLFSLSTSLFAEICPDVTSIKNNQLAGWQVYNANSGHLLNPTQLAEYQHHVSDFALATYYPKAPEGAAQCYYTGKDYPDYLDAYLAKQGIVPNLTLPAWHHHAWSDQCDFSREACEFIKEG